MTKGKSKKRERQAEASEHGHSTTLGHRRNMLPPHLDDASTPSSTTTNISTSSSFSIHPKRRKRSPRDASLVSTSDTHPDLDPRDMATLTTPSGALVTLQSAGFVLSSYIHSYGGDPANFKLETGFTVVAPPVPIRRVNPPKPAAAHQPPLDSLFHAIITLPAACGVEPVQSPGEAYRSKDQAKKHAVLEMVKKLVEIGEIQHDLTPRPRPTRQEPRLVRHYERLASKAQKRALIPLAPSPDPTEMAGKVTALKQAIMERLPPKAPGLNTGTGSYFNIPHSQFWDDLPPLDPSNLHPTIVQLTLGPPHEARSEECRVICIFTAQPLPIFADSYTTTLDVSQPSAGPQRIKVDASVRLIRGRKMHTLEESRLEQAMRFTQRLVRSHTNKPLMGGLAHSKWLAVPMVRGYQASPSVTKIRRRDIAWDEVALAAEHMWEPFTDLDPAFLRDRIDDAIVTPRHEFGRRIYPYAIREDLQPSSPHPSLPNQTVYDSVGKGIVLEQPPQPIIEGEQIHLARSGGYVGSMAWNNLRERFALPTLSVRFTIAASVFRATSILPTVLHLIDDQLIGRDISDKLFGNALRPVLALQAINCPAAHSVGPTQTYQRLELLGDTLLKFIVTTSLLHRMTGRLDWDKFQLEKQVMTSNRTLQKHTLDAGIVPYIRGATRNLKDWVPIGWWEEPIQPKNKEGEATGEGDATAAKIVREAADNKGNGEADKQEGPTAESQVARTKKEPAPVMLGDKVIADVAESLIAAGYLSHSSNIDAAIVVMQRLAIPIDNIGMWGHVAKGAKQAARRLLVNSPPLSIMGYVFQLPQYGRDAITLTTDVNRKEMFQRFRVMGDAALDLFMIEWLYHQYPDISPGAITVMRHSRHGDACLGAFCVVSGLIDRIIDIPGEAILNVRRYAGAICAAKKRADMAKEDKDRWEFWSDVACLSSLGDIVNAVFGAILVDSAYDIEATRAVFQTHFLPFAERYCVGPSEKGPHPRTIFSEMIFKRGCQQWEMRKVEAKGWERPSATVVLHGKAIGHSEAEQIGLVLRRSCEQAIKRIEEGNLLETLCTCPKRRRGRTPE